MKYALAALLIIGAIGAVEAAPQGYVTYNNAICDPSFQSNCLKVNPDGSINTTGGASGSTVITGPLGAASTAAQSVSVTPGTGSPGTSQATPLYITGSSTSITTQQVSVGTTAVQVCGAHPTRHSATIENLGTTQVFIGANGVTTTSGALLVGTAGSSITIPTTASIFAIVATGTQSVSCLETF